MSRLKSSTLLILSATPIFFGVSFLLLSYYKLGDQEIYQLFYELMSTTSVFDVMNIATNQVYLSTSEPITAYTLWVGAQLGIPKDIYISLLNVILLTGLVFLLRKNKAPWYIYALLLTNYYLIVLMTGAERLKIAYIIIIYAAFISGRAGILLAATSPLAHLSSVILLVSMTAAHARDVIREVFSTTVTRNRNVGALVVLFSLSIVIFLYAKDTIVKKAASYTYQYGGIPEVFNIIILILIGLIVSRDRFRLVMSMIPMACAAFLIGGLRVNMLAISVFIYLLLIENRLQHPLVILLLTYFSLKSIPFVSNIFLYRNGFGGWLF